MNRPQGRIFYARWSRLGEMIYLSHRICTKFTSKFESKEDNLNRKIRAQLAAAKQALSDVGIDTTGEGAQIPAGYFRVMPELAEDYRAAGHDVVTENLVVNGQEKTVTMVKFGDPDVVSRRVLARVFFPKPNEAT